MASQQQVQQALDIVKAAVSSGDKGGFEALNYPEKVAKLIDVVLSKLEEIAKKP